jgi:branched-chain amino acid aminotransferase
MHIIDICREKGIKLEFDCVTAERLTGYDSAFMSGTSPVVLPFCRIGNVNFNVSHRYIKLLRDLYLEKAEESMRNYSGENPLPGEPVPTE